MSTSASNRASTSSRPSSSNIPCRCTRSSATASASTCSAGYSKSDFSNPIQTTVALDALNVQGYSYDFTNGRNPTFNYGNLDVTNPNSFILGEIRLRPQFVENDFKVARAQLEFDVDRQRSSCGSAATTRNMASTSQEFRRASETDVPARAGGPARGR